MPHLRQLFYMLDLSLFAALGAFYFAVIICMHDFQRLSGINSSLEGCPPCMGSFNRECGAPLNAMWGFHRMAMLGLIDSALSLRVAILLNKTYILRHISIEYHVIVEIKGQHLRFIMRLQH